MYSGKSQSALQFDYSVSSLNSSLSVSFRAAKSSANVAISALAVQMETTPFRQLPIPDVRHPISPYWTPEIVKATSTVETLGTYNSAMDEVSSKISCTRAPLNIQMESWEKSTAEQRQHCVQKAIEDCMLVCDVIAPNDGKRLFQPMMVRYQEKGDDKPVTDDVVETLMSAYKNAKHENTKIRLQVLDKHSEESSRTVWKAVLPPNLQSTMSRKNPGTR